MKLYILKKGSQVLCKDNSGKIVEHTLKKEWITTRESIKLDRIMLHNLKLNRKKEEIDEALSKLNLTDFDIIKAFSGYYVVDAKQIEGVSKTKWNTIYISSNNVECI